MKTQNIGDKTRLHPRSFFRWPLVAAGLLSLIFTLFLSLPPRTVDANSAPSTPNTVSVKHKGTSLDVSWDAPAGATKYHITYSSDGKQSWSSAKGPGDNYSQNSITITGAESDKTYVVGVRAGNQHGWSGWRNSAPAAPGAPAAVSNFWADRPYCGNHFKVRWQRVSGATGYDLNISYDGKASWHRLMTNKNNNAWQFSQWNREKTYWFAIRAVNAHGASSWKNLGSAPGYEFCSVEGLWGGYASGTVYMGWQANPDADGYDLNFSPNGGNKWYRVYTNTPYTSAHLGTGILFQHFLVSVRARKGNETTPWRNATVQWITLEASNVTETTATLNLSGYVGNWYYKADVGPDTSCQGPVSGASKAVTGLSPGTTYKYKAYVNGCNTRISREPTNGPPPYNNAFTTLSPS